MQICAESAGTFWSAAIDLTHDDFHVLQNYLVAAASLQRVLPFVFALPLEAMHAGLSIRPHQGQSPVS